jgi:hypothetical protein
VITAVDTSVLLDVFGEDPRFGPAVPAHEWSPNGPADRPNG